MNDFSTPVVLIVFNRPEMTQRTLAAISKVKPQKLYVIADGPRTAYPDDHEKCQVTRAVIDTIDWKCHVFKNYADQNLGCQQRIYSGLNWVFDKVESAIIIEDDCLPDPSFFQFCDELLTRYKNDERIAAISGNNFQFGRNDIDDSYYFSRYPHCWGWATWSRAWRHCDITMKSWPEMKRQSMLASVFNSPGAIRYWSSKFQDTYEKRMDSWSFPWTLSCWLQSGLTILPNVNLVANIGFGPEGTHHHSSKTPFCNVPVISMKFPLRHPKFVLRHNRADAFTQRHKFGLVARGWRKFLSLFP